MASCSSALSRVLGYLLQRPQTKRVGKAARCPSSLSVAAFLPHPLFIPFSAKQTHWRALIAALRRGAGFVPDPKYSNKQAPSLLPGRAACALLSHRGLGLLCPFGAIPRGTESSTRRRFLEEQEQEQGPACWEGAGSVRRGREVRGEEGEGGDGESEPCLSGWK